jgi:hypothetical protein
MCYFIDLVPSCLTATAYQFLYAAKGVQNYMHSSTSNTPVETWLASVYYIARRSWLLLYCMTCMINTDSHSEKVAVLNTGQNV